MNEEIIDELLTTLNLLRHDTDHIKAHLSALVRELQELNKTLQSFQNFKIVIRTK